MITILGLLTYLQAHIVTIFSPLFWKFHSTIQSTAFLTFIFSGRIQDKHTCTGILYNNITFHPFVNIILLSTLFPGLSQLQIISVCVSCSVTSDCNPMDCSPPGSSVHGILQAKILKWVAFPSPEDLSHPRIEPKSPTLQVDILPPEPARKTTSANH